jgi:hypothetical protein
LRATLHAGLEATIKLNHIPALRALRHAIRAIAVSYRRREVSSWPIDVLGVNCVVYTLPANGDLQCLLAALAHDVRIKSARPLFNFTVESVH